MVCDIIYHLFPVLTTAHVYACTACTACTAQVREAQLEQYNYILVVGNEEKEARTVNVRTRDNVVHGMYKVGGSEYCLHATG